VGKGKGKGKGGKGKGKNPPQQQESGNANWEEGEWGAGSSGQSGTFRGLGKDNKWHLPGIPPIPKRNGFWSFDTCYPGSTDMIKCWRGAKDNFWSVSYDCLEVPSKEKGLCAFQSVWDKIHTRPEKDKCNNLYCSRMIAATWKSHDGKPMTGCSYKKSKNQFENTLRLHRTIMNLTAPVTSDEWWQLPEVQTVVNPNNKQPAPEKPRAMTDMWLYSTALNIALNSPQSNVSKIESDMKDRFTALKGAQGQAGPQN